MCSGADCVFVKLQVVICLLLALEALVARTAARPLNVNPVLLFEIEATSLSSDITAQTFTTALQKIEDDIASRILNEFEQVMGKSSLGRAASAIPLYTIQFNVNTQ